MLLYEESINLMMLIHLMMLLVRPFDDVLLVLVAGCGGGVGISQLTGVHQGGLSLHVSHDLS